MLKERINTIFSYSISSGENSEVVLLYLDPAMRDRKTKAMNRVKIFWIKEWEIAGVMSPALAQLVMDERPEDIPLSIKEVQDLAERLDFVIEKAFVRVYDEEEREEEYKEEDRGYDPSYKVKAHTKAGQTSIYLPKKVTWSLGYDSMSGQILWIPGFPGGQGMVWNPKGGYPENVSGILLEELGVKPVTARLPEKMVTMPVPAWVHLYSADMPDEYKHIETLMCLKSEAQQLIQAEIARLSAMLEE